MANSINRLSADSIQDFDDVRTWTREQEIQVDQLHDEITELRDTDEEQQKAITRNLRSLLISTILFGSTLAVIIVLFGIKQIIQSFF